MSFKVYVKIPAVLTASQKSELKKPTFERAAQAEERKPLPDTAGNFNYSIHYFND